MTTDTATLRKAALAASAGPWHWWGSRKRGMYLGRFVSGQGRTTVMDFVRQGMSGAQPRFNVDHVLTKAEHLAVREVDYREDITGIDHPDAIFIAAADPTTVLALLDERDRLRGLLNNVLGQFYEKACVGRDVIRSTWVDVDTYDAWCASLKEPTS